MEWKNKDKTTLVATLFLRASLLCLNVAELLKCQKFLPLVSVVLMLYCRRSVKYHGFFSFLSHLRMFRRGLWAKQCKAGTLHHQKCSSESLVLKVKFVLAEHAVNNLFCYRKRFLLTE